MGKSSTNLPQDAFEVQCENSKYEFGPWLPGGLRTVKKYRKAKVFGCKIGWKEDKLKFDKVMDIKSVADCENVLYMQNPQNFKDGIVLGSRMVLTICGLGNFGDHYMTSVVKELKLS